MPRGGGAGKPLRADPEVGVGPLLDGVAGEGLQIRQLRGREDNEVFAALPVGQLR